MSAIKNNSALIDQLMDHFSLKSDPFGDELPAFFEGAQRQHNLETLRHMSTFGDMVLLLTGEKGSGKTSLIERLVATSADDLKVLSADAQRLIQQKDRAQSVIRDFLSQLGLSVIQGETTRQSFSRLMQYLDEQFEKDGHRYVLVFDNADALPKKELQFYFSHFSSLPKENSVAALFSGAPALLQLARLSNVDGNEEWLHQIQLKPLGAAEMLEYLQLRLELAGYTGLLELTESQVQHLVDSGKGVPGRINRLFSSVVLEPGALKLPLKPRAKVPKKIFVVLALLLGVSFVLVSYQHGLIGLGMEQEIAAEVESDDESDAEALMSAQNAKDELLAQQRAARLVMLDQALSESLEVADGKKRRLEEPKPPLVNISSDDQPVKKDVLAVAVADAPVKAAVSPEGEGALAKESLLMPKNKLNNSTHKEDAVKPESASLASKKKQVVSEQASKSESLFRDKAWVLSQSPKAYSAQILGSYNEATAKSFAKRMNSLGHEVFYLETLYKKKPWFVVFYGVFPTKAEASKAVKAADKEIRSQQPWLRRFDGIIKSYP